MNLSYDAIMIIILGVITLIVGIAFLVSKSKLENKKAKPTVDVNKSNNKTSKSTTEESNYKKNPNAKKIDDSSPVHV